MAGSKSVLMSWNTCMIRYALSLFPHRKGRTKLTCFWVAGKPVPIPSYLIAIASGNLVYKAFPRIEGKKWTAGVWTEVRPPPFSFHQGYPRADVRALIVAVSSSVAQGHRRRLLGILGRYRAVH